MAESGLRGRSGRNAGAHEAERGNAGSRAARRPSALLIDDGELEDVNHMLARAGARVMRLSGGTAERGWRQPKDILIVTGRRALTLGRPTTQEEGGFRTIAIFDEDSKTLRERLERMGFDHIVRRPVHPEALRLLVVGALYRERDKRAEPRLPFGWEVRWRSGWRRGRATMSEISARGCSMQLAKGGKPHGRLELRIPAGAAGHQAPLVLPGRVICYRASPSPEDPRAVSLGVLFEELEPHTRQSLTALLAQLEVGPPTLAG